MALEIGAVAFRIRRQVASERPVDRVPVTPDYVVGPGDEIMIRAWGAVDIDYRAIVDRNGAGMDILQLFGCPASIPTTGTTCPPIN